MHMPKLFPVALVAALFITLPASAEPKAKKTKEEQQREREVKAAAREASRYEKLKEFSTNLYENDLDFRDAVEAEYEQVLRSHSNLAFNTNISRTSYTVVVHEDRFRQHVGLYDNLLIQDYVNRLGQKLVPPDSDKLFAFRLTPSPIPTAQTLATGTIYISTGLVAALENEAQLVYVLAHEMAHVHKDHWKLKSMLRLGEPEFNKRQAARAAWWSLLGAAAGAGIGAAAGRSWESAALGAFAGGAAGLISGFIVNPTMHVAWDRAQEDEADRIAFKVCLDANYDVREVPKLYLALQNAGRRDSRATLGFMGNPKRVKERIENANDLIAKAYKAEIELKQSKGELVGDNPEFRHLMAELKRDNGILAYYYDMFALAKDNLAEAVAIRSNDPAAHYFYGKVLQLVGRSEEEKKLAKESFILAAKYDTRGQNFGAHLHHALAMMSDKNETNQKRIIDELQSYVNSYLKFAEHNARGYRLLPPNLEAIYGYMTMLGDTTWTPSLPNDAPMFVGGSEPKVITPEISTQQISAPATAPAGQTATTPATSQPQQKKGLLPIRKKE